MKVGYNPKGDVYSVSGAGPGLDGKYAGADVRPAREQVAKDNPSLDSLRQLLFVFPVLASAGKRTLPPARRKSGQFARKRGKGGRR